MILYAIAFVIVGFVLRNRSDNLRTKALQCEDDEEREVLNKSANKAENNATLYFVFAAIIMIFGFIVLFIA